MAFKDYIKYILKWICFGALIGALGGVVGTVFHKCLDWVTEIRQHNSFLIYLLPLAGVVIALMYKPFAKKGNIDTKRVFQSVKEDRDVPLVMMPLIFLGSAISHLFGASMGREGAALQLGGSLGYNVGTCLKQNENDRKIMVVAGMGSVFSALFGTPLAAAIFSLEVTGGVRLRKNALVPGFIASIVAFFVSQFLGATPVRLDMPQISDYTMALVLKTLVLAALCAVVCIVFALAIHKTEHFAKKCVPNGIVRGFAGGALVVLLTVLVKTTDYNGAGMDVITRAISGEVSYEAFALKILFTVISIAAGFKGGEIVPTFFIGATFGCAVGGLMGIDPALGATIGFVALFAGMTKCPVAAFLLGIEVFGSGAAAIFVIPVVITYLLSGKFGLYNE